ncbi:hypothetical protein [Mycobacterium camsae]|uniref:hypothetical protein n=1 Tax=Mycobacterium gordonae TaxID=1778 RepID=UPI0019812DA7|nr:hypothetical protein [Mycobacterium gordonae]
MTGTEMHRDVGFPAENVAEGRRGDPPAECVDEDMVVSASAGIPPTVSTAGSGTKALLTAIACTVLGFRLTIISSFASGVPILDQWDAEASGLYSRYLKGVLNVTDLFAPHNEHRIVFTRLLALVHLELAGEWNTRLEMIIGAIALAVLVTWLAALLLPLVAPRHRVLTACFIALLFALPLDFENTLWGFQSQVYLSLLFGLATLVAFAQARPFSPRWFGGLAAATLSYFSFALGLAAIIAAVIVVGVQLITRARRRCGRELAAVGVLGLVAVVLVVWGAQGARPKSNLWTFLEGLGMFTGLILAAAVPLVLLCRQKIRQGASITDPVWLIAGIFGWVVIQLVLLAYGRGTVIAPRYMDVVLLPYPLAFVAVITIAGRAHAARSRQRALPAPSAWVFAVVTVIAVAGYLSVLASSYWAKATDQQVADVRAYLATGDVNRLAERGTPSHGVALVFPDPQRQGRVLRDPDIQAILPPELRPADADNTNARNRMLLKGRFANATATAVHSISAVGPALLALGTGVFFALGTADNPRGRRESSG